MDFPGRLIAGFVCMVLIVLFPLQYIAQVNMETIDYLVEEKTSELSDNIRSRGYIDQDMYEQYLSFLDSSNERYDIHFENVIPITGQDLSKNQEFNKNPIKASSLKYINPRSLSNEENLNQFLKLSDSSHVHTKDCYEGHRHDESCGGFSIYGSLYEDSFTSTGSYRSISLYCASCKTNVLTMVKSNSKTSTSYCSVRLYGESTTYYYEGFASYREIEEIDSKMNKLIASVRPYIFKQSQSDYGNDGASYSYYIYIPPNIDIEIPYMGILRECPIQCTTTANDYTFYRYYDGNFIIDITCFYCRTNIIRIFISEDLSSGAINYYNMKGVLIRYQSVDRSFRLELMKYPNDITIAKNHPLMELSYIKEGLSHGCVELGSSCGLEEDTVTICDKIVSITANPPEIEVEKYTKTEDIPFSLDIKYINHTIKTVTTGYRVIGYSDNIVGKQSVMLQYMVGGTTHSVSAELTVKGLTATCPICQTTYELNPDDSDPGCSFCIDKVTSIEVSPLMVEVTQGDPLPIKVIATYYNGNQLEVTGWSSSYNPYQLGYQVVLIEYGGHGQYIEVWVKEKTQVCMVCGFVYPLSEAQCPQCLNSVTHISLSHSEITVKQYDLIDIVVTAFYLDGTSREVVDWTIDYDTSKAGSYLATVYYGGDTAFLTLHVLSEWAITCNICGLVYEPQSHPIGCPVCSTTIIAIEAYLTLDSYKVQIGAYPSVMVVAIYQDEHRELKEEGFKISEYDPNRLGFQIFVVEYHGFYSNLEVEVVNNLQMVICENGHMYYIDDNEEDKECPFCNVSNRNEVVYYYDIIYWNDIINTVYETGKYEFQAGSYITISVVKKEVSTLARMQRMFFRLSLLGRKRYFISGGEISSR